MSEGQGFVSIDIGGGTDIPPDLSDQAKLDYELNGIQGLRSVKLARENPDKQFYVIDISLYPEAIAIAAAGVPNVHFIQAEGGNLPIREAVADQVEINHLFFPVHMAHVNKFESSINGQVQARKDEIVGRASGMMSTLELEERVHPFKKYLYQEARKMFDDAQQILDSGATDFHDFNDYFALVSEAARVLKPGAELRLAEKEQRAKLIERILSSEGGMRFLQDTGLEVIGLESNTDPNMSRYARRASVSYEKTGNEKFQPVILTLEKLHASDDVSALAPHGVAQD